MLPLKIVVSTGLTMVLRWTVLVLHILLCRTLLIYNTQSIYINGTYGHLISLNTFNNSNLTITNVNNTDAFTGDVNPTSFNTSDLYDRSPLLSYKCFCDL